MRPSVGPATQKQDEGLTPDRTNGLASNAKEKIDPAKLEEAEALVKRAQEEQARSASPAAPSKASTARQLMGNLAAALEEMHGHNSEKGDLDFGGLVA